MPAVHKLIKELATFERARDEVTNTVDEMIEDCFSEKPVFGCHVAELDGEVVGMAVYYIKYSTWKGKGLYLDDLIVTEKHRKKGIGQKLFNAYIEEAKELGVNQLHWQVLDWNTPAIEFYKKYGASIDAEWLDCKMTKKQINDYK